MKVFSKLTLAAAIATSSFAFTVPALADSTSFNLTDLNATGYGGPFATVTVTTNATGTQATLTFDAFDGFVLMDGSSVGANINGAFSFVSVTGTAAVSGFTQATYTDGGSGNVNGFGVFNETITSSDGFQSGSDIIEFVVNKTSGSWASAAAVLVANSNNALAAAHIGVCQDANGVQSATCTASNGAKFTGFAAGNGGGGTIIEIPEPNALALALLGFGLVGVSYSTRRKS